MSRALSIPLPPRWPKRVKSGLLHAVALGRAALLEIRTGFENSPLERARLIAKAERLEAKVTVLEEELRIKDARMQRIPAAKRLQYPPAERLAILTLRAASGWTAAETARRFLLTAATIATWMRRLDEQGADALVQTHKPVHRLPDFVALLVKSLKVAIPAMGKVRIAQALARAGLVLAPSTAARLLCRDISAPVPPPRPRANADAGRSIFARGPHHTWHADLSVVPTLGGFWVPWIPQALLPLWPFCFWVAVVLDHFSRAVVAHEVFGKQPSEAEVCALLDGAVQRAGRAPRYIVTDQGVQFRQQYKSWCAARALLLVSVPWARRAALP
jgi:transposase InsO family protein